jgi:NDP-sugar pyrophosphorylase family protein
MKYAIIAAGMGSRLTEEGIGEPKPLVKVGGEQLIDRLIRIFLTQKASEIDVICNERDVPVCQHLSILQHNRHVPLKFIVKTTASSMHSLFELSALIGEEPFVLTTVDTIFHEHEFAEYVQAFQQLLVTNEADGLMAVTDFIDDEQPLYLMTDDAMNITAFKDDDPQPHFISGGIYGLTPCSMNTLYDCIARGESRMRNFQRALITDGVRLKAFPFSKILDVDHAADIEKANQFLL